MGEQSRPPLSCSSSVQFVPKARGNTQRRAALTVLCGRENAATPGDPGQGGVTGQLTGYVIYSTFETDTTERTRPASGLRCPSPDRGGFQSDRQTPQCQGHFQPRWPYAPLAMTSPFWLVLQMCQMKGQPQLQRGSWGLQ